MKSLFFALIGFAFLTAPAFANEDGPGHSTGPAHPSAFLCKRLNGRSVFASGPKGGFEYCVLDAAKMSSMSLWYSLNGELEKAARIFLAHPQAGKSIANAAAYCKHVGGNPESETSYDGKLSYEDCVFVEEGHQSSIGLETLFRGPAYPGNRRLTELLQKR